VPMRSPASKATGSKKPLLIMGHSDTVKIDPAKWTFPPFSATPQRGYVYGRGTLDDKANLYAAMMTMVMLKRTTQARPTLSRLEPAKKQFQHRIVIIAAYSWPCRRACRARRHSRRCGWR